MQTTRQTVSYCPAALTYRTNVILSVLLCLLVFALPPILKKTIHPKNTKLKIRGIHPIKMNRHPRQNRSSNVPAPKANDKKPAQKIPLEMPSKTNNTVPALLPLSMSSHTGNTTPALSQLNFAEADATPQITDTFTINQVDRPPAVLVQIPPVYPFQARLNGLEGEVVLLVSVNRSGTVSDVKVLSSTAHVFVNTAVEAVKSWRYRPAEKNSQTVAVKIRVPIKFELNES